jgi:hypothetical protein
MTNFPHGARHVDAFRFFNSLGIRRHQLRRQRFRLVDLQGFAATPA